MSQYKWIFIIIGSLILVLLAFTIGMYVGTRKANFSFRWGENYHRVFGGPRRGFFEDFMGRDYIAGHGTAGTVIKIEKNALIIKGTDGVEKTITISDDTTIRKGMQNIKISDIAVNNQVVIIGSPKNDGTIDAELIRIFDGSNRPLRPAQKY